MDLARSLKQSEGVLSLVCDRAAALNARLEDLLFRAQRIAATLKKEHKNPDAMYGYDLQHFRQEIRRFGNDIASLPAQLGAVERTASSGEDVVRSAQSLMRACERLNREMKSMQDKAVLAHQHMREAEYKIEAWYLVQDVQEAAQRAQPLPNAANRIILLVGGSQANP